MHLVSHIRVNSVSFLKNENGHYKQFLGKLQLDKCLYVLCHGIAFLSEVSFLNPLAVRFSKLGVAGIHG